MTLPSGLAVDSSGNLWVVDPGNNRILRFQRPMEQQGDFVSPNLVIGQKTVSNGNVSNQGQPKPSDKTLSYNRGGSAVRGTIAFDPQGNLWATDTLNNRVLRFPKDRLNANEPAADLVLGQTTFDSDALPTSGVQSDVYGLVNPIAVTIDDKGGVYVSDGYWRVVYYDVPSTGVPAARILGINPPGTQTVPQTPPPNQYTLGRVNQGGYTQCLFTLGTVLFVCDSPAHRVVRYGSPETWPTLTTSALSPPILGVYGQNSFTEGAINRGGGLNKPGNNTFNAPSGGAFFNGEMWIADSGNHRVVALSQSGALNFPVATRVLGQLEYDLNAPNLVDGKELYIAGGGYRGSGIAVDYKSTPNHLYIADSLNNRILGFRDSRTVGTDSRTLLTQTADIVIGQQDRFHTGSNYPTYDPFIPTDQGLNLPSGVAVDGDGNVWVADTLNGRVLRFPDPFKLPAGTVPRANLVLGQAGFSDRITDPSSTTMAAPVGVTVFNYGDVAASDFNHNRILLFRKSGADFANGQPARAVLGQQNFSSIAASGSANGLSQPRGLASDSNGRLYVADSANNRIVVYSGTNTTPSGATGTSVTSNEMVTPEGVAVSPNSGEFWVASYNNQRILRFPEFTQYLTNPGITALLTAAVPIGITLDASDNVIAAEATNRVTFYYARLAYRHAATYAATDNIASTLTPGMYTLAARLGKNFDFTPTQATIPYPKTLGGIQVLVDGVAAPITSLTAGAIYFLVPNNAPTSGVVEYLVTRPATGEIIAAGNFSMGRAAPGFFTANQAGTGQIAACNDGDCTKINGPSNPIGQDEVLTLWLTGYGHQPNAPPDGEAAGRPIETTLKPDIRIGAYIVPPEKILYSGMSSQYPGLWQINIRTPKNGEPNAPLPNATVPIALFMDDVQSNIGGTTASNGFPGPDQLLQIGGNRLITTFAMK